MNHPPLQPSDVSTRPFEVWSASPTPLDANFRLDCPSMERLVNHYVKYAADGIFLAGNAGEGPYLADEDRRQLVRTTAETAAGRLKISVQVSDNSAVRILEKIDQAQADGADMAIMSEPFYMRNSTKENLLNLYQDVLAHSPLPMGIYNLGNKTAIPLDPDILPSLYGSLGVMVVKDSSSDPLRRDIALKSRQQRSDLRIFNGDEFLCLEYAEYGYDGVMFGGGCFNLVLTRAVLDAVAAGDSERAKKLNAELIHLNRSIYGREIQYSLAGMKYLLVCLGIFTNWENFSRYPLPSAQRKIIEHIADSGDLFCPR